MRDEGTSLTPLQNAIEVVQGESGALVDRVSSLIEQTRAAVAARTNAALTLMNWHIGHMIDVEVLGEDRAGYDKEIVATLSQQLNWSHLNEVVPVRALEARTFYINQAISAHLSVRALRDLIGRQGFERKEIATRRLPVARWSRTILFGILTSSTSSG